MPTYEYACTECGQHLEVVQSFTDDSLTVCPNCEGRPRKIFGNVGVTFKGSGFYKTDSRGSSSSAVAKSSDSTPAKESTATPASDSSSKADAKPAAASSEPKGSSNPAPKSSDTKAS